MRTKQITTTSCPFKCIVTVDKLRQNEVFQRTQCLRNRAAIWRVFLIEMFVAPRMQRVGAEYRLSRD